MQQRILFCSSKRTFSPKQTQHVPKNSCTSDFFPKGIQRSEVRASSHQTILVYPLIFRKREPKVRGSNAFMSHNRALMKKQDIDIFNSANIPYKPHYRRRIAFLALSAANLALAQSKALLEKSFAKAGFSSKYLPNSFFAIAFTFLKTT